jgi:ssDNA-binding Zn-finger/Zn-ribbon topoisomerase 1
LGVGKNIMREIGNAGTCPKCNEELKIFKSKQGGRFIKCSNDECNVSYPIPRIGTVKYVGLVCPKSGEEYPILLIQKVHTQPYFWVKNPCFTCNKGNSCESLKELKEEFLTP